MSPVTTGLELRAGHQVASTMAALVISSFMVSMSLHPDGQAAGIEETPAHQHDVLLGFSA